MTMHKKNQIKTHIYVPMHKIKDSFFLSILTICIQLTKRVYVLIHEKQNVAFHLQPDRCVLTSSKKVLSKKYGVSRFDSLIQQKRKRILSQKLQKQRKEQGFAVKSDSIALAISAQLIGRSSDDASFVVSGVMVILASASRAMGFPLLLNTCSSGPIVSSIICSK